MLLRRWTILIVVALLTACATRYGADGISGGFSAMELEPATWRVRFSGNEYTKQETVQTYWLYRCAELALEKGFDGFEVLSDIQLMWTPPFARVQVAAVGFIYLPLYYDKPMPDPSMEGDVRLLRRPFTPEPRRRFDAAVLKAALHPYIVGQKCEGGNVCPHVHHYLINPEQSPPDGRK